MNITYVSSFDATDITSYSGTGYYIPNKLHEAGNQVEYIGNLKNINPTYLRLIRKYYDLRGKKYLIERNPGLLKKWAKEINSKINKDTDVLVGYSSQPFAQLKSGKPQVFWSDGVFGNMVDYYEVYSNLCKRSLKDGHEMERSAMNNCTLAVFSSEWAAKAAVELHHVPKSKIRVVPYGANIDVDFTVDDIKKKAENKDFSTCKLLFIGVEWERKGGDKAVQIAEYLNNKGIKTELSVVGVDPGEQYKKLDFVKVYGFISKSTKAGKELLNKLISESHFLVLPSRADCTPIVYSEFNAHGIPALTTNEGGIPGVVTHGVNGYLFDKDSEASVFCAPVLELFEHKEKYTQLSISSFNEYKTRLNWNSAIKTFEKILEEAIAIHK